MGLGFRCLLLKLLHCAKRNVHHLLYSQMPFPQAERPWARPGSQWLLTGWGNGPHRADPFLTTIGNTIGSARQPCCSHAAGNVNIARRHLRLASDRDRRPATASSTPMEGFKPLKGLVLFTSGGADMRDVAWAREEAEFLKDATGGAG